jgi:N-acetylmuramic acid 6-phosphate etherase
MTFTKTTEQSSKYEHLEKMSVQELLSNINQEDKTVPLAVEKALPQIETLVTENTPKIIYFQLDNSSLKQLHQYFNDN